MRQDFAVAGIGRLRTEHDRPEPGAAELFVQQRKLQLAKPLPAHFGPEVARPQPFRAHFVLQRADQPLEFGIMNIPLAAQQIIHRFDFLPNERIGPIEPGLKFRIGRK